MKNLLVISKYRFMQKMNYLTNVVLILISTAVVCMVQYFIWKNVENQSQNSTVTILTYSIHAVAITMILPLQSTIHWISSKVKKGEIVTELIRPVSLFLIAFFHQLGEFCFKLVYQLIPLMGIMYFGFGIALFQTIPQLFMGITAILLAFVLCVQFGYIVGFLSLLTVNISGVNALISAAMIILGGAVLPIELYPAPLAHVCTLLPFYAMMYGPVHLLQDGSTFLKVIAIQGLWMIIFTCIIILVETFVRQKVDIMGG